MPACGANLRASAECPELVALFDRLLAAPAPLSGPPALIHGDPKLSNLMWQDQRITAMLDWEMALNGEPLANLGYMLFFFASEYHAATRAQKLPGMLARDEVIALWEQVSGRSAARGILARDRPDRQTRRDHCRRRQHGRTPGAAAIPGSKFSSRISAITSAPWKQCSTAPGSED